MAGKETLPQESDSVKPKQLLTAFQVKLFSNLQMLGYMVLKTGGKRKRRGRGEREKEENEDGQKNSEKKRKKKKKRK